MRLSWLTAALLLLLPQSLNGQSIPRPLAADWPANVAMLDATAPEPYIEQLAKGYRIQVYNIYRTDREQYTQRRIAWQQTLDAWRASDSPTDHRDKLINWLRRATLAVESVPPGPIPPRPVFDAKVTKKPAEQLPKPDKIVPTITPPTQKPLVQKPPVQPPVQPLVQKPVRKPAPTGRQTIQLPTIPKDINITPAPSTPTQAKRPDRIAPRVYPPQRYARPRPSVPRANRPVTRTRRPPSQRTLADRRTWRSPRRSSTTRTRQRRPGSGLDKSSSGRSQTLLPLPGLSAEDLVELAKADKGSVEVTDVSDNFVNFDDSDLEAAGSEVNLIELAARIAGTNMALRGVEAQLSKTRKWDATQLTTIVAALKQLCDRRDDLTLFRNLLPESKRRLVGQLESARAAISQCSARMSETRSRIDSRIFDSRPKQREEELKRLDVLSRQLAKLVTSF